MDLERLQALAREGRTDELNTRLAEFDSAELKDPKAHLELARLCAEAGLPERLMAELNLAHRDDPEDVGTLRQMGAALVDSGKMHKAIKCYRRVVDKQPQDLESWEELGSLLQQTAQLEEASDAYARAFLLTGERRFEALRARLATPQRTIPEADESQDYPSSIFVQRFVALFSGREGVYARQWVSQQEVGYTPIREPFTPNVANNHLLGNHTVGVYPLRNDNTVNFAAIDLDLNKATTRRFRRGTPQWQAAMERLVEYSLHLQAQARLNGLASYLEESGSKGRHLWLFFSEPLSGRVARNLGRCLYDMAGPAPQGVGVEVFPKQHQLPPEGLGNLIKLPLGVHRLTGRRAVFVDEQGEVVSQGREERFLADVERVGRREVVSLLEQATPVPEVEPADGMAAVVAAVPRALEPEYFLEQDDQLQLLLSRCHTLRALAEKAELASELSHDEARVLMHTVGHLPTGPQAVNAMLRKCPGAEESLYLRRRLRGNPMSCAKIRSRIPGVTSRVPCNCEFAPTAGLYPTPALHLDRELAGADLSSMQLQALLEDFLRVRREMHQLSVLYERYHERLCEWFEQAGIDELRTPLGPLVREQVEGSGYRLSLKV